MSHTDYACPTCQGTVLRAKERLVQTRPHEFYRCPDCWSRVHFRDLKPVPTLSAPVNLMGVGGGPPPLAVQVNLLASGGQSDEMTVLSVPNLHVSQGSTLIVGHGFDYGGALSAAVSWNGHALSAVQSWQDMTLEVDFWALYNATGGTGTLLLDHDGNPKPHSEAFVAIELANMPSAPFDNASGVANASSGTVASGASITTSTARDILVAFTATMGPSSDTPGVWGNSFTAVARAGTTSGLITNSTISAAYRIVDSTANYPLLYSGFTNREWVVVGIPFKRL